jgi:sulfoxide reductase catalytic subunit YedY
MLIRRRRGWELPEIRATSEAAFRDRRRLLQGLAAGPLIAGLGGISPVLAADANSSAALYPARRDDKYKVDRIRPPTTISTSSAPKRTSGKTPKR